jgi:plasmid rolling circle replication initiator protein Rep
MEFANDVIKKMEEKQKYNRSISAYFYKLYLETKVLKYKRLSENVKCCLNYMLWDKYDFSKVMDLRKVNRCKNRFCSNCRKLDLCRALNNLEPKFGKLINEGYYPYLLTLTVPNCRGDDLKGTLDKMQKAFKRFYRFFSYDDGQGFKPRFIIFDAAVKCIEVNYSKRRGDYHPHYHILVLSKQYDDYLFWKQYEGEWSNNRQSMNMYSEMDLQIRKLWTIAYDDLSLKKDDDGLTVYDMMDGLKDTYLCDIKEMDATGIYEVMKYCFKDSDIENYGVFKTMYFALKGRRIRQGHGLLYNLKLEEGSDGNYQEISDYITENEQSVELATHELRQLYTVYSDYIKISRFRQMSNFNKIAD